LERLHELTELSVIDVKDGSLRPLAGLSLRRLAPERNPRPVAKAVAAKVAGAAGTAAQKPKPSGTARRVGARAQAGSSGGISKAEKENAGA